MTTPQVPVPAATEYVVLKLVANAADKVGIDSTWDVVKTGIKARGANEALRKSAGHTAGVYIAVPARSWKPVTVTVETTTSVKLT